MAIATNPQFVLDCPDPAALARFYAALLDWEVARVEEDGGWASITDGRHPPIHFQRVDGFRPPVWPGQEHPQQIHLDVDVPDLEVAEGPTLALGATKHPHQPGETFRVYLDPAGHPFCLCVA
ncbi:VOC family protein [Nocardioides sp. GY 10113]|uniref:VOC family protein n=1 Tax=Nocardioides sp. GY 10113 TaxID=2569761 RepID=UPI0010A93295|nr:VOC family protein [Nocardioides sp. GY 10113]TIC83583.1 VOC family protein [Nocardioides sp. GY 10113]